MPSGLISHLILLNFNLYATLSFIMKESKNKANIVVTTDALTEKKTRYFSHDTYVFKIFSGKQILYSDIVVWPISLITAPVSV